MLTTKLLTIKYVDSLIENNFYPKNVSISHWRNWAMFSAYDELDTKRIISESVQMGIDKDQWVALGKCLTEYVERKVAKQYGKQMNLGVDRLDGYAAYPVYLSESTSNIVAKKNAELEAVERFMWANWWDNDNISFDVDFSFTSDMSENISQLIIDFNLEYVCNLKIQDSKNKYELKILLAKIKNKGFVTGGNCSFVSSPNDKQAFGELLRHLIAQERFAKSNGDSFYEKRLISFASGSLNNLVYNKIERKNMFINKIALPRFKFNCRVEHPFSNLVSVHRSLFYQQPVFMGGKIERLCI